MEKSYPATTDTVQIIRRIQIKPDTRNAIAGIGLLQSPDPQTGRENKQIRRLRRMGRVESLLLFNLLNQSKIRPFLHTEKMGCAAVTNATAAVVAEGKKDEKFASLRGPGPNTQGQCTWFFQRGPITWELSKL